jgi:hypothetical protein
VLVSNPESFARQYPGRAIAGTYAGRLSNSGERLTIVHAVGTPIFSVEYGTRSPWPRLADGGGFSLVSAQPNANPDPNFAGNWRASAQPGGSPGTDDPAAGVLPVLINEILTNTDPPQVDAIELHNPNNVPAPIGGWWLTDNRSQPRKFQIPAGVVIPPGGFVVFDERDFNQSPGEPGSFSFSSRGEEAWLFSADANGALTGFSDGVSFGAAPNGVSFGRHTNSVGEVTFPLQSRVTLGEPNAGPLLSPVVLSEIHFQPTSGDAEFVEVHNHTDTVVPLYHPDAPENTWRISGINFSFPANVVLPAGGFAVVTAGDPELFRARFGVPEGVAVFGPYLGVLQDSGETVALQRPGQPEPQEDGSTLVPYIDVDAVTYANRAPWPAAAAGGGVSLERLYPLT